MTLPMLDKTFDPTAAEPRIYKQWEESGLFAPRTEGAVEAYNPAQPSAPATAHEPLVGDNAAASAASAFAGLASTLRKPEPADVSFPSGPTIDEMVRGLLRPMLKEWLDANLPAIVETQVRKEVERIARTAG